MSLVYFPAEGDDSCKLRRATVVLANVKISCTYVLQLLP